MSQYVLPHGSKTCFLQNLCLSFPMSSLSNCFPDSSYSSVRSPTVEIRSNASRTISLINLSDILCLVSLDQNQPFFKPIMPLFLWSQDSYCVFSCFQAKPTVMSVSLFPTTPDAPKMFSKGYFPMKSNRNNTVTTILTHCRCLVTPVTCESKLLKAHPSFHEANHTKVKL